MLAASPQSGKAADLPDAAPGRHTYVVRVDPRSGRLVRREIAPKIPPRQITELVEKTARAQGVDPLLVHSMIRVESNYDARAVSPKGAQGLMQLMPSTARMLGVNDSFDARENIEAGVKYLKYLQSIYKDDRLALAAYNAGPGAVEKYGQIPPYQETRNYVERVGRDYQQALKAQKAVEAAPAPAPVTEEKYPRLEQFIDQNGRLHLRTAEN
ncbi:MAG TPA: lytic transglycosylase domain-containing protein [Bryobacteraceae bacterium]|jgi:soluble lytic murein transglycosylase-like protein|nr:lytic transglycosylase domain-containing protein [Bryobacteraceae bacterium]